ncbi:hypothetical protein [Butyrivibrio fibrisolvens]|uniref:hypothetical protein n=1 Tax=Butyrivibrio fibrisolvens TaxID=831 RepID=UPI0020BF6D64|nr:hypothetical protein [Butyrivibrio fibrisolvens]
MTIILKILRWIMAAVMWFMALGSLINGGLGIIGAILFVIVGILISPLSSKYIFPKLPNLKKSHKITGVAVIWLAANVFLGLSPAATKTNNADKAMSTAAVSEASVESVDRSMADVSTVEASEEDIVVAEASTDASIETSSNSSIEEKSVESADKNKKSTASSTVTTAKSTKTTSVASTGSTTESATTETKANSDAEKTVAEQKAAEEAAAQQAAEEAAAAQQPDSSTVANGTESANALEVLQMGPTTGDVCWVPRNGGTKYHTKSTCSGMDDPICTTVDTAEACGFEPCKHCH